MGSRAGIKNTILQKLVPKAAMIDLNPQPEMNAYEFILENIDSVPQLEALVLLWNSRPVAWSCE